MSQNWKDWVVPKYSTPEVVERLAESFEYFDDDVLINTYAKSGTTLTQEIVYCLLHGVDSAKQANLFSRSPFIDWGRPDPTTGRLPMDCAGSLDRPRVLKTHLPAAFHMRHLNQEGGAGGSSGAPRVIVVMRNPKDTMVSAYHHFNGMQHHAGELPDNFSDLWKKLALEPMSEEIGHHNYFDFTLSWWSMRSHPRVRVYFYEDMVTKKKETVASIAQFLGVDASEEQIKAVVEHTEFSAMRNNANVNPSLVEAFKSNFINGFNFIRKGQIGDWKNHFTVADNELMDRLIAEKLGPSGLKFVYE